MKKTKKYSGVVIPAVTPVKQDLTLDEGGVEKLFQYLYNSNTSPFILGTTGEASSIPFSMKTEFFRLAGRLRKEGTTLYAGISANVFVESVGLAHHAFEQGADVVVATLPSYYALTEKAMMQYLVQLADAVGGPLMIYNIPATTHMSIPLSIVEELSHHPNIVGLKDSERSEERLAESLQRWQHREDFSHFIGWAAQSVNALTNGSDGLVPSTGNLFPLIYWELYKAVAEGKLEEAAKWQRLSDEIGDLYQKGRTLGESLYVLKLLMHEMDICEAFTMPPIYSLTKDEEAAILNQYKQTILREDITLNL